ncbi:MAG: helix-turn-helix domain-containing protein, partial [Clostridia bacterium]|nr:helix-turn-helix domain-containing protein [Clostridia bacterium]
GQGFVMFPDTVDTMSADHDDPWHFCWMIFGGRDAYGLLRSVGITEESCIFEFDFFDKVTEVFEDLLYSEHSGLDMDMYMYSKFYELMSYHKKRYSDRMLGGGVKQGYVRQTINYINENYASNIKIEEIAAMLHISRKYLCRIFVEYRGISPKEYLILRRVEEAARLLLETDLGIREIAHLVGYGDYTQLSSIFKAKKGCSPQRFRALSAQKNNPRKIVKTLEI